MVGALVHPVFARGCSLCVNYKVIKY